MYSYLLLGSVVLLRKWSLLQEMAVPSVQHPSVTFSTYVVFRGVVVTFTHSPNLENQGPYPSTFPEWASLPRIYGHNSIALQVIGTCKHPYHIKAVAQEKE
jgi:hypothetical protein